MKSEKIMSVMDFEYKVRDILREPLDARRDGMIHDLLHEFQMAKAIIGRNGDALDIVVVEREPARAKPVAVATEEMDKRYDLGSVAA
jgi:hypothetical protein